jgi:ABC-type sulfate transport system permease component
MVFEIVVLPLCTILSKQVSQSASSTWTTYKTATFWSSQRNLATILPFTLVFQHLQNHLLDWVFADIRLPPELSNSVEYDAFAYN